jgi:adenylate kinase
MRTIQVKYDEVYAETAKLINHLSSNITDRANAEYNQIQSLLDQVDGSTNAELIEFMETNRQKTTEAAATLEKLLQFISNSAKQIEINEERIAHTISAGRRYS